MCCTGTCLFVNAYTHIAWLSAMVLLWLVCVCLLVCCQYMHAAMVDGDDNNNNGGNIEIEHYVSWGSTAYSWMLEEQNIVLWISFIFICSNWTNFACSPFITQQPIKLDCFDDIYSNGMKTNLLSHSLPFQSPAQSPIPSTNKQHTISLKKILIDGKIYLLISLSGKY